MQGLTGGLTEGLVVRDGNFLEAVAEVGLFEHCLTTDLLNHLVFVQKIFMKVNCLGTLLYVVQTVLKKELCSQYIVLEIAGVETFNSV